MASLKKATLIGSMGVMYNPSLKPYSQNSHLCNTKLERSKTATTAAD